MRHSFLKHKNAPLVASASSLLAKLTSDKLKRQAREDNMKNAKRILEKFDSWKYDIYESNKSDWTKQDDNDVNEIEKLLNEQASEQRG